MTSCATTTAVVKMRPIRANASASIIAVISQTATSPSYHSYIVTSDVTCCLATVHIIRSTQRHRRRW